MKLEDLTGFMFGKLTVLRRDVSSHKKVVKWICRCECGTERSIWRSDLKSGSTKSCGCMALELSKITKMTRKAESPAKPIRERKIWRGMKDRCQNPGNSLYARYGARGISVSEEWQDFENFFMDMGFRPSPLHSLDRIDNSLGYSKENCRWATSKQQNRNRRSNKIIDTPRGPMVLAEAAEAFGVNEDALAKRIKKGLTGDELFKPICVVKSMAAKGQKMNTAQTFIEQEMVDLAR